MWTVLKDLEYWRQSTRVNYTILVGIIVPVFAVYSSSANDLAIHQKPVCHGHGGGHAILIILIYRHIPTKLDFLSSSQNLSDKKCVLYPSLSVGMCPTCERGLLIWLIIITIPHFVEIRNVYTNCISDIWIFDPIYFWTQKGCKTGFPPIWLSGGSFHKDCGKFPSSGKPLCLIHLLSTFLSKFNSWKCWRNAL